MVRLAIDFEFSSRTWWDAGGQELWDAICESIDGNAVLVDDDLAESWLAQARAIEGWEDGTEYAPHPIRLGEIDPDDEELL